MWQTQAFLSVAGPESFLSGSRCWSQWCGASCKPRFHLGAARFYRAGDSNCAFISLWRPSGWVANRLLLRPSSHLCPPRLVHQVSVQLAGWWVSCCIRKVNVWVLKANTLKAGVSRYCLPGYLTCLRFFWWKGAIGSLAVFEIRSVLLVHLLLSVLHQYKSDSLCSKPGAAAKQRFSNLHSRFFCVLLSTALV